jgi:hypothetical protein
MPFFKFPSFAKLMLVCIALLAIFPSSRVRSADPVNELFQGIEKQEIKTSLASNQPAIMRVRWVRPDFGALAQGQQSGKLRLNLFDDAVYQGMVDRIQENLSGSLAYSGHLENIPESSFILVSRQGILMGTIRLPGAFYRISYQDGEHLIQQLDDRTFPSELEPIPAGIRREESTQIQGSADDAVDADDGSQIDVLVVYTAAARQSAGNTQVSIETLIDTAVAETNIGYQNSGVSQRLNLVHRAEVDYIEDDFNWSTTLSLLRGTSDGVMDEVHTLRNMYCADEVVLLVGNMESCGLAYVMQDLSTSFANKAFAIVSWYCATGYYSFAHEMGHNMGSAHDHANASVPGVYDYSYGYQDPDGAFRSIMAYANGCPGECPRVNYWSNPGISMYGRPMGVISTDPLAADNHMSLNNTAYTVSNFRPSSVCMPNQVYVPLLEK